jgi:hypothetical protein
VVLSCLITFPLTFGWIRFTYVPPAAYQLWFFGLPMVQFPIEAGTGFALFHALDWTMVLLIIGVAMALWRRMTAAGLLTTQRFGFDLMPLVLLLAIAVTGLALTASSLWWEGKFYGFISLTHQITVMAWLLSLPFGKFFHIIERPTSIGVTLYQTINQDVEHSQAQTPLPTVAAVAPPSHRASSSPIVRSAHIWPVVCTINRSAIASTARATKASSTHVPVSRSPGHRSGACRALCCGVRAIP